MARSHALQRFARILGCSRLGWVGTAILLSSLLVALARPPLAEAATPCVFTEAQAWWATTPGKTGSNFGHVHAGACMPFKQEVSGLLNLQVRVQLHNNPGTFLYLNPVMKTDSQEISLPKNYSIAGRTCPLGTCIYHVPITVDTRLSKYDGLQEIRIRLYIKEPDGKIMHTSVNTIVDIRNGKPVNNLDRKAYQRGKGWYTGAGYCESSILSDLPIAPMTSWHPTIQVIDHGTSEDRPVTRYSVILDADFHRDVPGTVLRSGTGQLPPTTIDVTGLAPGQHKLLIKAECDDPQQGSTNMGLLVTQFTIR